MMTMMMMTIKGCSLNRTDRSMLMMMYVRGEQKKASARLNIFLSSYFVKYSDNILFVSRLI